MKKPFFSVIIPTWRENKVLKRCLNSLLNQDYPADYFEIILASKAKISPPHPKVKPFKIKRGINHAVARNLAVQIAQGEILAFCDDDCILPPAWLSLASAYFKKEGIDLVGGPVIPPQSNSFSSRLGGYLSGSRFTVGFAAPRHRDLFPEKEANEFDLILANTFIRKKVFEKFGGFSPHQVPCEENFLYAQLKKNGHQILYSPKIACFHPAKPVILPWARKIFFYATGRGLLSARAPQTFHPQYLIPSLFITLLATLIILSFSSLLAQISLKALLVAYLGFNLLNSAYIFFKFEKNPLIFLVAPLATFIIHLSYGLGFLYGFFRYLLGQKQAIKMPSKD